MNQRAARCGDSTLRNRSLLDPGHLKITLVGVAHLPSSLPTRVSKTHPNSRELTEEGQEVGALEMGGFAASETIEEGVLILVDLANVNPRVGGIME